MKKVGCGLFVLLFVILSFAENNGKKGFRFGIGISPAFSYLLVSSSSGESQAWYSNYLGGLSAELRLGYSKSENIISSFISSLTWDFPSSHFAYSLFNGYAFTFFTNEMARSRAYDFFVGLFSSHVAGLDNVHGAWGIKAGFKTGYKFKKRFFFWIGSSMGFQYRNYAYPGTELANSGEVYPVGEMTSQEVILPVSIFASITYSIF